MGERVGDGNGEPLAGPEVGVTPPGGDDEGKGEEEVRELPVLLAVSVNAKEAEGKAVALTLSLKYPEKEGKEEEEGVGVPASPPALPLGVVEAVARPDCVDDTVSKREDETLEEGQEVRDSPREDDPDTLGELVLDPLWAAVLEVLGDCVEEGERVPTTPASPGDAVGEKVL